MAKKKHRHPSYDPVIEAGIVTLTLEQAHAAALAIAEGLRSERLSPLMRQRAVVAVTALNDVFGLGIGDARPAKREAAR
jgi:hypothetical protein